MLPSIISLVTVIFSWTWAEVRQDLGSLGLSSHRKVYEFLSTFITSGMRFLLNQQVQTVAGQGDGSGVGWVCPIPDSRPTFQICPVLYHAGTVLLNSLLDTVPGELELVGWGALGQALGLEWG